MRIKKYFIRLDIPKETITLVLIRFDFSNDFTLNFNKKLKATHCLYLRKFKIMGLVYATIEIINYADETLFEEGYLPMENIRKLQVNALADSGAIRLSINENIKQ